MPTHACILPGCAEAPESPVCGLKRRERLTASLQARGFTLVTSPEGADLKIPDCHVLIGGEEVHLCSEGIRKVETRLLNSLRKPADGLISRWINRPVSLAITRRLMNTGVKPNHLSVMTLLLGIVAGFFVSSGTYQAVLAGALLLQLQSMLDGVDGELARLKFQGSQLGQWLDTVSDDAAEFAFLAGLTFAFRDVPFLFKLGLAGLACYAAGKIILYLILAVVYRSGDLASFSWKLGKENSASSKLELFFKHDFFCLLAVGLALLGQAQVLLVLSALGAVAALIALIAQLIFREASLLRTLAGRGFHSGFKARKWIARIFLLIGIVGLAALLGKIGWQTVLLNLKRLGWAGAFCLLGAGIAEGLLDALALREAALGRLSLWKAFLFNQAGSALNAVAPADAGEILKASLLRKYLPGKAASATLVWNMAFRLTKPLVIIGATLLAWAIAPSLRSVSLLPLGIGLLTLGLYFALNLALRFGGMGRLAGWLSKLPFLHGERALKLAEQIAEIESSTADFGRVHPWRYGLILFYQALARTGSLVSAWIALHFLGASYPFAAVCLVFAGTQLLSYLLPWLPTRVGVMEGSGYVLFRFLKLDPNLGVIFQLVMTLQRYAVPLLALAGLPSALKSPAPSAAASR